MNVNRWMAGLAIAMFASVLRPAIGDARPGEVRDGIALLDEDTTPDSTSGTSNNPIGDDEWNQCER